MLGRVCTEEDKHIRIRGLEEELAVVIAVLEHGYVHVDGSLRSYNLELCGSNSTVYAAIAGEELCRL